MNSALFCMNLPYSLTFSFLFCVMPIKNSESSIKCEWEFPTHKLSKITDKYQRSREINTIITGMDGTTLQMIHILNISRGVGAGQRPAIHTHSPIMPIFWEDIEKIRWKKKAETFLKKIWRKVEVEYTEKRRDMADKWGEYT